MSFLNGWFVYALPLAALPIIIHLINQRRYQTTRWAAMMFLLAANKMSRGYAKLRQWIILAMRVLAVAGLIFVVGRPLTGGWLGQAAGGRADTTILLLDRSPSMQQVGLGAEGSKLATGRARLARTLKTVGSARWVLIEGGSNKPKLLDSIDALANTPAAEPSSAPPTSPACSWPHATTSAITRRAAPKSGSAPTPARTTGPPRAAAGPPFAPPSSNSRRASASTSSRTPSPRPATCPSA